MPLAGAEKERVPTGALFFFMAALVIIDTGAYPDFETWVTAAIMILSQCTKHPF